MKILVLRSDCWRGLRGEAKTGLPQKSLLLPNELN